MAETAFRNHNHRDCVIRGVGLLKRYCNDNSIKLSDTRQAVFKILLEQHKAIGAYEILARLQEMGLNAQPPVAYRHLDFLVNNGFAHKIERFNAFIACTDIGAVHDPAFFICKKCRLVSETSSDSSITALHHKASAADFEIEESIVEVLGMCPDCR